MVRAARNFMGIEGRRLRLVALPVSAASDTPCSWRVRFVALRQHAEGAVELEEHAR